MDNRVLFAADKERREFGSTTQKQRDEIQKDVEAYLAGGGQITRLSSSEDLPHRHVYAQDSFMW